MNLFQLAVTLNRHSLYYLPQAFRGRKFVYPVCIHPTQCLGQVQVHAYPRGVWCGSQGPSPPPNLLEEVEDGGAGGRVLHSTLPQRSRGHLGRPTVPHHFQCGSGCSGLSLGIPCGGTGGRRQQQERWRWVTDCG